MAARSLRLPGAAPVPRIALMRMRQQIVVRSPNATERVVVRPPRPVAKTLLGLGPEERAFREKADTVPAPSRPDFEETPPPVSGVRMRGTPVAKLELENLTPRPRPVTLIDGVHDGLSEAYLAEAARLLASGLFRTPDPSEDA